MMSVLLEAVRAIGRGSTAGEKSQEREARRDDRADDQRFKLDVPLPKVTTTEPSKFWDDIDEFETAMWQNQLRSSKLYYRCLLGAAIPVRVKDVLVAQVERGPPGVREAYERCMDFRG